MRNISPLSDRFDLKYIRKSHYPNTWVRAGSIGALILVAGYVAAREWTDDKTMFSSGPLTRAHAIFADDCSKCHLPVEPTAPTGALAKNAARFWLPAQDSACLVCHTAPAHNPHQSLYSGHDLPVPGRGEPVKMASDCRVCHVEHRGADADLNAISDTYCTQCHANLDLLGRAKPASSAHARGGEP